MKLSPEVRAKIFARPVRMALACAALVPLAALGAAIISYQVPLYGAVIILTMAAYGLYRLLRPSLPPHHERFIHAAFAAGTVVMAVDAFWICDPAVHGEGMGGIVLAGELLALPVFGTLALCVFRLTQDAPERLRAKIAAVIALVLCAGMVPYGFRLHDELTRQMCRNSWIPGPNFMQQKSMAMGHWLDVTPMQRLFHAPVYEMCEEDKDGRDTPVAGSERGWDIAEQKSWYHKKAEHGDVGAQFILGSLCRDTGDGKSMLKWWKPLADAGDDETQFHLGGAYLEGQGVPKDTLEGLFWRSLAEKASSRWTEFPDKTEEAARKKLTPDQKSALDQRVAEWKVVAQ